MISFRVFDNESIIEQRGQISRSATDLIDLISDPISSIRDGGFQVGRTVGDQFCRVYGWDPCQRIVLDDTLSITTAKTTTIYPAQQFWEPINVASNEMQQLLSTVRDPVAAFVGYYGYLSYELSHHLEAYQHGDAELPYPLLILELPSKMLVDQGHQYIYLELDLPPVADFEVLSEPPPPSSAGIVHSTDFAEYVADIRSLLNHIQQGDIYQANYTQQFQVPYTAPLVDLYHQIIAEQNLPHAAMLNYGSLQVMSLSPELFLRVTGGKVTTQPIKGTRPRGLTARQDMELKQELLASTKDHAELAMIVDLLRNDLGKSALPGSVEVDRHATIESYENVHHLVSTISARTQPTFEASWHLLLRAFPGGSISGVPKLRALELIDTYEKCPRGIYTGNIGYVGLDGTLDMNIAIRTAIALNHQVMFNAGGGIVLDSDPVDEYLESLHKAKHLANYLGFSFVGHLVICDGSLQVADRVGLTPTTTGVFETILVEQGSIVNLQPHLDRLYLGMSYYNINLAAPSPQEIEQLLHLNLVTTGLARLNIKVWRDDDGDHILTTVAPYQRPSAPVQLSLSSTSTDIPPSVQQGLKSLDYSTYRKATRSAQEKGCWDMVLYTSGHTVTEGGRCTIYAYIDGEWLTPDSGVVEGIVRQHLLDTKAVRKSRIELRHLLACSAIAISNALIGVVPVIRLVQDGSQVWQASEMYRVNELRDQFHDNDIPSSV